MADDYGDKTEDPTPRKRQEAREQGKVARSRDLATAVLIIGSMVLIKIYGPGLVDALRALVREMLGADVDGGRPRRGAVEAVRAGGDRVGRGAGAAADRHGPARGGRRTCCRSGWCSTASSSSPTSGPSTRSRASAACSARAASPMQGAIALAKLVLVGAGGLLGHPRPAAADRDGPATGVHPDLRARRRGRVRDRPADRDRAAHPGADRLRATSAGRWSRSSR